MQKIEVSIKFICFQQVRAKMATEGLIMTTLSANYLIHALEDKPDNVTAFRVLRAISSHTSSEKVRQKLFELSHWIRASGITFDRERLDDQDDDDNVIEAPEHFCVREEWDDEQFMWICNAMKDNINPPQPGLHGFLLQNARILFLALLKLSKAKCLENKGLHSVIEKAEQVFKTDKN